MSRNSFSVSSEYVLEVNLDQFHAVEDVTVFDQERARCSMARKFLLLVKLNGMSRVNYCGLLFLAMGPNDRCSGNPYTDYQNIQLRQAWVIAYKEVVSEFLTSDSGDCADWFLCDEILSANFYSLPVVSQYVEYIVT